MVLLAERYGPELKMAPRLTLSRFQEGTRSITHFFGTRRGPHYGGNQGDVGTVKAADPDFPVVVSVQQVHGTDTLILDRRVRVGEKFSDGWDAILTNQPKALVTVRTADCVPVLLADPKQRIVGAVHAGWRGAVHGIVPKTVQRMVEHFGCEIESIQMAIGPSAGPCCYEVDGPVIEPLQSNFADWASVLTLHEERLGKIDLKALVRRQAQALGIPEDQIYTLNMCTICRSEQFFSYRREGAVHGTMVSGIMLS
ncbi:peptidoglycan editing factor PgeF [Candidatus Nitronereus thalassa]|uniref:Purine nucleoside phosphorylase n=1 Tax=Candidatus Nitronereus thalassa TaxID=3020898 RepID=A0ABU3KAA1_9BACT|nr:peptidoglycan editing factor PgeF [Candidatus Nitronereus thalassa]MDT7043350.1 peptidoglycan editing factor PgeF [Candidatus Nitronereus thalassa]